MIPNDFFNQCFEISVGILKKDARLEELELILSSLVKIMKHYPEQDLNVNHSLFDLYLMLFYTSYKNQSYKISFFCLKYLLEEILISIDQGTFISTQ